MDSIIVYGIGTWPLARIFCIPFSVFMPEVKSPKDFAEIPLLLENTEETKV
jgi:hypothetical protein